MQFEVEHLGLAAGDPRALCEWYRSVLAAEVLWTNAADPPAFILRVHPGWLIEIYPGSESADVTRRNHVRGWRHLALRVASLDAARTWLENRGVTFSEVVKPAGGGGRVLFFSDPEGNLLHLVERPSDFRWNTSDS